MDNTRTAAAPHAARLIRASINGRAPQWAVIFIGGTADAIGRAGFPPIIPLMAIHSTMPREALLERLRTLNPHLDIVADDSAIAVGGAETTE